MDPGQGLGHTWNLGLISSSACLNAFLLQTDSLCTSQKNLTSSGSEFHLFSFPIHSSSQGTFRKAQKVNTVGFLGHVLSAVTTQLCHCRMEPDK